MTREVIPESSRPFPRLLGIVNEAGTCVTTIPQFTGEIDTSNSLVMLPAHSIQLFEKQSHSS